MTKVPNNWHVCATCVHWCGSTMPDRFCAFVEVDTNERARCAGGAFNNSNTVGMHSCSSWVQRFRR